MIVYERLASIEKILEEAKKLPFSSKVMIDADEMGLLLKEIKVRLKNGYVIKNWFKMDRFSIQNIQRLDSLESELDFEKASSLFLKLRVLEKEDESYKPIRNHLRNLIKDYEEKNIINISHYIGINSDLAETLVQAENDFYEKRKKRIKAKLKEAGLTQNDLAKILGHRKSYMSELINGLRPFSKEDLIVINRLFKIKLEDLIPTFIKQDRASHIKKTLESLSHSKIKLTKSDFDLQMV